MNYQKSDQKINSNFKKQLSQTTSASALQSTGVEFDSWLWYKCLVIGNVISNKVKYISHIFRLNSFVLKCLGFRSTFTASVRVFNCHDSSKKFFTWAMEVFSSDRGSYNMSCGSKLLREPKNFKTKEFTWATEVNSFQYIT
jgi:hypothetical protein